MILYRSGLPITMNEITGELSFHNGLQCDGFTKKKLAEMTGLYKNADGVDPNQLVYWPIEISVLSRTNHFISEKIFATISQ